MNYEELYENYQALEKILKDKTALIQRLQKSISREMESGDLKSFDKDVELLKAASEEQMRLQGELQILVAGFDRKAYFEEGDFAGQMLEYCSENEVDVKGEFPVYEMFPYRIRLDVENQDIYMDRKKVQCMRPSGLVNKIKAGQDRLLKASFNASAFLNELAEAYDLLILKAGKQQGTDLYLSRLYRILTPMSRYRRDYDQQSYAFDLARLYSSEAEETKDGRRFQFGPSRNINQAIRILDRDGQEQYLATIRFFQ
ncbi:MAG: hypothetical protein PHR92_17230 [Lachnospiraceae bacterium]|nr:hypothetical protein [Lachnospiraceae bacterium]